MSTCQTSKTSYQKITKIPVTYLSVIAKNFIYIGIAFYISSLPLVSLFTSSDNIQGIWILLVGWMGIIIFQLSWFANPLNLLAMLLITKRPLVALCLSIIAFLLASQAFSFSEIPAGLNNEKVFIKDMGLGFYFWYVSHGLFLISTLIEAFVRAQKDED